MIGPGIRRLLLAAAAIALGLGCLLVLEPFIVPMLWAGILAYTSWPLFRLLRALLRGLNTLAALLMTLIIGCAVVLPVLWMLVLVHTELANVYPLLTRYLSHGVPQLPVFIRRLPWVGPRLQEMVRHYLANPTALAQQASTWVLSWMSQLGSIIGSIGRNLLRLALSLLTLFFLFRDGEQLVQQGHQVVQRLFDNRLESYLRTAGRMTRAVVYGLLITACAQGLVAGIGYAVLGIEAPVLFGVLTGILSFVPLAGTAIVWVPLAVWLMFSAHVVKGIVLLGWGVLLVHPVEDVLRPLLMSNAARMPFLLAMFGALGGLTAFGLIGLFVGPVLLAIAVAVWREWATRV